MSEVRSVVVTIGGREYTVRGEADEDYIRKLAKYVDEKLEGVAGQLGTPPSSKSAIMTALQIADELHQLRVRISGGKKDVDEIIDQTLLRLEEALQD